MYNVCVRVCAWRMMKSVWQPFCTMLCLDRLRATTACISLLIFVAWETVQREQAEVQHMQYCYFQTQCLWVLRQQQNVWNRCSRVDVKRWTMCFNVAHLTSQCFCVGVVLCVLYYLCLCSFPLFILPVMCAEILHVKETNEDNGDNNDHNHFDIVSDQRDLWYNEMGGRCRCG